MALTWRVVIRKEIDQEYLVEAETEREAMEIALSGDVYPREEYPAQRLVRWSSCLDRIHSEDDLEQAQRLMERISDKEMGW